VTYADAEFAGTAGVPIVGGVGTPRFDIIDGLSPDLLIVSTGDLDRVSSSRGGSSYRILAVDEGANLDRASDMVRMIGEIFNLGGEADRILRESRDLMEIVRAKVEPIPPERRLKTVRVIPREDGLYAPGEDSFQTEITAAAGGIPGRFGHGAAVRLTLQDWLEFNPDVVFCSNEDYARASVLLERDGWRDAAAVESGRVFAFPGSLTDRASTRVGRFTAWLSSMIYTDEFADSSRLIRPNEILSERVLFVDIPCVKRARIVESRIMDFVHRTLLLDFKRPQTVVSTMDGERKGIMTAGNSASPTPAWSVYNKLGFERSMEDLLGTLGLDRALTDMMVTGADMDNLSVKSASCMDMTVTALVTAGVDGNAIRTSKDIGAWYEPGTINIMLLTNRELSMQAAAGAIVTVTEAKTAALWDMDTRSVQTPLLNPATGTGTDAVIVVTGDGPVLHGSGGHTKMGELIADAVYRGVQDALLKQNGMLPSRSVFSRLAERGISIRGLTERNGVSFRSDFEALLFDPRYCGFLEAAFSLSDAREMGQVSDTGAFLSWALLIARDIAGRHVRHIESAACGDIPEVLGTALAALITGLKCRNDGPVRK
jgi:adenosylcobinamide amidohydrolase/ABC-type Fe3+-hydroxamate transport system substrate-binding protein